MKKLYYLIVLALILGLVLTGCSLLSNVGQVPTNEQSRTSPGTIVINGCDTGVDDVWYGDGDGDGDKLISVQIQELYDSAKNHGEFVRGVAMLTNDLMKDGIITGKEKGKIQSCAAKLKVGDIYGGGIVAYIFVDVDHGYFEGEQHGLIAATADATSIMTWSNILASVGTTGTAIGTGQANTTLIVNQAKGCTSGAAYYCDNLTEGGYDDWFLPSKDELNKLYFNKVEIGGFADIIYWSSSQHTTYVFRAWYQNFGNDYQWFSFKRAFSYWVRAVRAF